MKKPEALCILPWIHVQTYPDGRLFPCCMSDRALPYGSLKDASFEKIWNGPTAQEIRRELLAGRFPKACAACERAETIGAESYREHVLREEPAHQSSAALTAIDGSAPITGVRNIELRLSNLCNFRCRTCGPLESSAWYREADRLGQKYTPSVMTIDDFEKEHEAFIRLILPRLEKIHFAGGEPLLHAEHYRLLERLLSEGRSDLTLSYNTNLSALQLKEHSALEYWQRFKAVRLVVSVDGCGPQGELLRKGFKEDTFIANLREIEHSAPGISIEFHSTISVMNVFHITEALGSWIDLGLLPKFELSLGLVRAPRHYSIEILIESEREEVRQRYRAFSEKLKARLPIAQVQPIIACLDSILENLGPIDEAERVRLRQIFRQVTFSVDRLRSERLVELFPELFGLLYET